MNFWKHKQLFETSAFEPKRQRTGALQDAVALPDARTRDSVLDCASPLALFTLPW